MFWIECKRLDGFYSDSICDFFQEELQEFRERERKTWNHVQFFFSGNAQRGQMK